MLVEKRRDKKFYLELMQHWAKRVHPSRPFCFDAENGGNVFSVTHVGNPQHDKHVVRGGVVNVCIEIPTIYPLFDESFVGVGIGQVMGLLFQCRYILDPCHV